MSRDIDPERVAASCTGKARFGSFNEANKVAKRARKNGRKNRREMLMREPYRCPSCHGYHLGMPNNGIRAHGKEFRRFMRKYEGRRHGDCSQADET